MIGGRDPADLSPLASRDGSPELLLPEKHKAGLQLHAEFKQRLAELEEEAGMDALELWGSVLPRPKPLPQPRLSRLDGRHKRTAMTSAPRSYDLRESLAQPGKERRRAWARQLELQNANMAQRLNGVRPTVFGSAHMVLSKGEVQRQQRATIKSIPCIAPFSRLVQTPARLLMPS
jgi:hypothetical protein